MNHRNKEKNKAPLLTAGIVLMLVGMMSEVFALMPIGIILIVFHIVLKKKGKEKKNTPAGTEICRVREATV